jgi:hypothetical protein
VVVINKLFVWQPQAGRAAIVSLCVEQVTTMFDEVGIPRLFGEAGTSDRGIGQFDSYGQVR